MANRHAHHRAQELRNRAHQLEQELAREREEARRWHLQDLADASRKAAD